MNPRTRLILIIVAVLVLFLVVGGVAFLATKKATTGPSHEPAPPPAQEEINKAPKMGRFSLGEFTATTRDEELHYIKIEVELGFVGALDKELEERKGELRDAINTILMKLTIQRAKEDYIDHFLHKDIEKRVNELLGTTSADSRIIKVFIPAFLIN
ncbi:MAG: flagellar basal body-associated FliL family protein [Candidatus Riflebacteria bacterium]|nr:flagellar basal body-associated FliL family protein [Candidatus Riflebacteria bacterium]